MITIDDIRREPRLGYSKELPVAKGKVLVPNGFGGVESTIEKPKKPRAARPLEKVHGNG